MNLDAAAPEAEGEPITRVEAAPLHAQVPLPRPLRTEPVVHLVVHPRIAAGLEEHAGDSLAAGQEFESVRGVHCERVPVLEIEGDLTATVPALDVPRPIVLEIVDVSLETHLPEPWNRRGSRAEPGAKRAVAEVAAPHESDLRVELVPDDEVVGCASDEVGIVVEPGPIALVVPDKTRSMRARIVGEDVRFVVETEGAVDTPRPVGLAGRHDRRRSILEQGSDVAPAEQVAFHADDGEVRWERADHFVFGRLDAEQADVEGPDLSRQSSAGEHLHGCAPLEPDPPGVEQRGRRAAAAAARPRGTQSGDPEVVHAPPFQEELALLREQEIEPCEVHLLLVHLDLSEVGVYGDVQRQVLRDCVLDVHTCVSQPIILDRGSHDPIGADPRGRKRLHLEVQPRRRRLDSDQIPVHRYAEDPIRPGPRHLDRYPGEVAPLIAAQHGPTDLNTPDLLDARAIAKRLEGNDHLRRPPAVEPTCGHIPDRVPVEVRGRLIGDLHFRVASDRGHEEADCVTAVAVGVEVDPERVVQAELIRIPAHLVRNPPRLPERIPHAGGDVQVRVVEANPDLRALRWHASRYGNGLDQVVKRRRRCVEAFAQAAIHGNGFADAEGADRWMALRVPDDRAGGGLPRNGWDGGVRRKRVSARRRLPEGTARQEQGKRERSGRKRRGDDGSTSTYDTTSDRFCSHCPHQAFTDARPAARISCERARSSTARARTIAPTNVAHVLMAFWRLAAFDFSGTSFVRRSTAERT